MSLVTKIHFLLTFAAGTKPQIVLQVSLIDPVAASSHTAYYRSLFRDSGGRCDLTESFSLLNTASNSLSNGANVDSCSSQSRLANKVATSAKLSTNCFKTFHSQTKDRSSVKSPKGMGFWVASFVRVSFLRHLGVISWSKYSILLIKKLSFSKLKSYICVVGNC